MGGDYKIPEKFSKKVMDSITEGIITKAIRSEIITIIALGMWQYTTQPTSDEYTSICRALVQKHPVLKDTNGNGYVRNSIALTKQYQNNTCINCCFR